MACQNVSLLFIYFFGVKYVTQWPLSFYRTAIKMYDHFTQSENTHEENKLHINYIINGWRKNRYPHHILIICYTHKYITYASAPDTPPPAAPGPVGPAELRDIDTPTVAQVKVTDFGNRRRRERTIREKKENNVKKDARHMQFVNRPQIRVTVGSS